MEPHIGVADLEASTFLVGGHGLFELPLLLQRMPVLDPDPPVPWNGLKVALIRVGGAGPVPRVAGFVPLVPQLVGRRPSLGLVQQRVQVGHFVRRSPRLSRRNLAAVFADRGACRFR